MGTNDILFVVVVVPDAIDTVVLFVVDAVALVDIVVANIIFVVTSDGEDGGDVFISSNGGVLFAFECVGAPFNAELLASCRYAESFGNISFTSSISLLTKN